MAMRRFCCLIDTGVAPMARSKNHVAWSKRDTYICEFMWLVKSYSDASTAPLKVWTHSAMMFLPFNSNRGVILSAVEGPLYPRNTPTHRCHKFRHLRSEEHTSELQSL